jgi:cyclopropane-fatty-acyl-phospholipid synthase
MKISNKQKFCLAITAPVIIKLAQPSNSEKFIRKLVEQNTDIKLIYKNSKSKSSDIIVSNKAMFQKILTTGHLGLAESYMDGDWDSNNLEKTLLELIKKKKVLINSILKNSIQLPLLYISGIIQSKLPTNTLKSSKNNIAKHYDIGNDLYSKMLGKYMQYTCAYFYKPNMTLDQAQYAKMELIAKKLDLKPGMKVIDIGCGFGSMAYHLATKYKVKVTGVTLSKEQKKYADTHFSHTNVKIEIKDYRHVNDHFDRVYSVGMFEHVGRKNYKEYYDQCYKLLKKNGIMLIHTIGTNTKKWNHNSFCNKYIFPEGELPHLSNLTNSFTEKWYLEDIQNFGISYSKTLNCWSKNIGNWEGLKHYDERFRRMWDFYIYGCSAAFLSKETHLWQIVYTKKCSDRNDNCHHIRN